MSNVDAYVEQNACVDVRVAFYARTGVVITLGGATEEHVLYVDG